MEDRNIDAIYEHLTSPGAIGTVFVLNDNLSIKMIEPVPCLGEHCGLENNRRAVAITKEYLKGAFENVEL